MSSLGRFMRPDDPFADQDTSDPQSWNLYSYVRNNPLSNTDPMGNACVNGKDDNQAGETCEQVNQHNKEFQQRGKTSATVTATANGWTDFASNVSWGFNYTLEQTVGQWLGSFVTAGRTHDPLVFALSMASLMQPLEGLSGEIEITAEDLLHVTNRHLILTGNKSAFAAGEDVVVLIKAAESTAPVAQSGRFAGNFERVVDAGRTIGFDRRTGNPTSVYTVITDANNRLVTAFPGRP